MKNTKVSSTTVTKEENGTFTAKWNIEHVKPAEKIPAGYRWNAYHNTTPLDDAEIIPFDTIRLSITAFNLLSAVYRIKRDRTNGSDFSKQCDLFVSVCKVARYTFHITPAEINFDFARSVFRFDISDILSDFDNVFAVLWSHAGEPFTAEIRKECRRDTAKYCDEIIRHFAYNDIDVISAINTNIDPLILIQADIERDTRSIRPLLSAMLQTPRDRDIFELTMRGLSQERIAQRLDTSRGAIHQALNRMKNRARKAVAGVVKSVQ